MVVGGCVSLARAMLGAPCLSLEMQPRSASRFLPQSHTLQYVFQPPHTVQFDMFTIMAVTPARHGMPLAFVFTSNQEGATQASFLRAFGQRMQAAVPGWKPSCWIVDDARHGINGIRCDTMEEGGVHEPAEES